jgi:hypothetical protein
LFFALAFALAFGKPCFAETSTEVLQRMNSYRDNDAQDIQQRTETRAWQEIRRKEEYARTWKCYGAIEVNASRWRQLPDLTWITEIKRPLEGSHCFGHSKQGDGIGQSVVVRFGDTLRQISQRTGVSLADLTRLNPGLEAARLVVGSQIRVDQSASNRTASILGIAPITSGGLSWPELPSLRDSDRGEMGLANSIEPSFVAINCAKLLIVQKPAYAPWGKWSRPDDGSSLEKLVVDRCASKSPLQ